jgi:CheY-like chemotaxis protein
MSGRPLLDPEDTPLAPRARAVGLLVVEDDADHREVMRDVLEDEGYRVDTAIHGRAALSRLASGPPPDLILLDLMMPEMDGWEFMAALKARPDWASIPVVVTSQGGSRVLSSAPVSAGYLAKPLDRSQLLQTVACCLWRRRDRETPTPRKLARVLVLDDRTTIGATIGRLLAQDHDVVSVTGGEAALARIKAGERYDVILCDMQLPDMTIMDLHARLDAETPEQAARMVFVKGATPSPEAQAFLARVHPRCIDKPFTVGELRSMIDNLLEPARDTLV